MLIIKHLILLKIMDGLKFYQNLTWVNHTKSYFSLRIKVLLP